MKVSKETLALEGAVGSIEAQLDLPSEDQASAVAVVCHPHPLYQGTMLNKVVHTLSRSCTDRGIPTLRFNYRGVGKSAGVYDEGVGETHDAQIALDYMRQRFGYDQVILAGFSFGAGVSLRLAEQVSPDLLITVAPPVGRLGVPEHFALQKPWLLVQGGADEVVDSEQVLDWAQRQTPIPEIALMDGVGHFFHGHLTVLRDKAVSFIEQRLEGS